jgi:predicted secreted protein
MAAVTHARGVKLLLKVGDGNAPEAFGAYCTINAARGITFTSATNEFNVPDCTDPDLIGWLAREKVSLSVGVSGAGMLNTPDVQDFFDWWKSENSKNCQIVVDVPSANGGVIFEGLFHLTEFAITGDRGGKMESTLSLASDGEVTSTPNT